jgi:hypothetical protein
VSVGAAASGEASPPTEMVMLVSGAEAALGIGRVAVHSGHIVVSPEAAAGRGRTDSVMVARGLVVGTTAVGVLSVRVRVSVA